MFTWYGARPLAFFHRLSHTSNMYQYDDSYLEFAELSDGSTVLLRPIRPSDKTAMQEGFKALSPHSRYQRVMGQKKQLTDHELRYLTEFDGIDHYAIGATFGGPSVDARGVGAGRFVRLEGTETAEPAVTITDEFQGKGLGTMILDRLLRAAWERGVRQFHFELLADNVGMKRLIEAVSHQHVEFSRDDAGGLIAVCALPEPTPLEVKPAEKHSLFHVLGHIARADVTHLRRSTLPPPPS